VERLFVLEFEPGRSARAVIVERSQDVAAAVAALGLRVPRPTLVVVGGADGFSDRALLECAGCIEGLVSAAAEAGAAIVDGGTDSGVMRLVGRARARVGTNVPLVGVIVHALAALPGGAPAANGTPPEANHTHFALVPGSSWGEEAPWIARFAGVLAGDRPSVTVLVNGGDIAWTDVEESVAAGRPVLTVVGTGRAADALAAAATGTTADKRAAALIRSGLVEAVGLGEDGSPSVQERVREILGKRSANGG
jgi:hypothetical protein